MFAYKTKIRLHDTDAAGVIFFANQLRIAHEAFEAFLDSVGLNIGALLKSDYRLPIVHAEADFTDPLGAGDAVTVELNADRLGETSFTMLYHFRKDGQKAVGSAQTVHVAVDGKTGTKRQLPDELRAALKKLA